MKKEVLAKLKADLHKMEIRHELTDDKQEKGELENRMDSLASVIERLEKPERRIESCASRIRARKGVRTGDRRYR